MKIGRLENNESVLHRYPHVWSREELSNGSFRLRIGPTEHHVNLLLKLAECLAEPFLVLYVLVVPRGGEGQQGRYESSPQTRAESHTFLKSFEEFLQGDGRAHLWLQTMNAGPSRSGLLVYDRHDLIYAYGPLPEYERVLTDLGLHRRESVDIPSPHSHHYHIEFDAEARRLLDYWDWYWTPLQPGDEI